MTKRDILYRLYTAENELHANGADTGKLLDLIADLENTIDKEEKDAIRGNNA